MNRKRLAVVMALVMIPFMFGWTQVSSAGLGKIKVPDTVKDISRQNTYPNPDMDPEYVQPSPATLELFKTTNYSIENPNLIRLLNESTIHPSKLAIGFRANIYLG